MLCCVNPMQFAKSPHAAQRLKATQIVEKELSQVGKSSLIDPLDALR